LVSKRNAEYLLLEKGNTEQPLLSRKKKKIDAMLSTQISNEDAVCLEIIHEKLKFFAVSMYLDVEEQIENSFTKIDEILQFAKGERILIATDSN